MNRWQTPRLAHTLAAPMLAACALIAGAAALGHSPAAQAQMQRFFPQDVKRGSITFSDVPLEVKVNGEPERLAPGVRVRTQQNTVALSGSLVGQTFVVNYLRDPMGLIREIWLLTPEEIRTLPDGSPAAVPKHYSNPYHGG